MSLADTISFDFIKHKFPEGDFMTVAVNVKNSKPQQRIVCAANKAKFTGAVVLGIRHYDGFMHKQMSQYEDFSYGDPVEQGFVDQFGTFLTRQEAWKIAEFAGQIFKRVGGDTANGGTLYSENLY